LNKLALFVLLPTISLIQPKSIHYSENGNYLVDQDGKRTIIQGHPKMICYRGSRGQFSLQGIFLKAQGSTIWLRVPTIPAGGSDWNVEIERPICDLEE
jgi:hypothetical protein